MALSLAALGTATAPRTATVDPDRARQYAAATNDDDPAYASGEYAPPVFAVVPTWDVLAEVVAGVVPPEALMFVVHGEQDLHFHRPLRPGMTLATTGEPYAVRVGPSGTRLVVRLASESDGEPVLEQYVTIFVRGMTDGESAGPDKPAHDFPEGAREAKVGEWSVHVDDDQTYRYRDASGDHMPIHLDADVARSVGLPGIIAHGLCTMAMCSQAVLRTVGDGDPGRLRRLAVRFAANVFPGNDVVTEVFDAGTAGDRRAYAFEATSAGAVVVKHGRAELSGA
ncbi:MAG TPA: MaoC/PaaZ C-terminal domain-containing protein [Acidimicrobiales bacterium]|jgi:acyl dehydratase